MKFKILRWCEFWNRYEGVTDDGEIWVYEVANCGMKGWYKVASFRDQILEAI